MKKSLFLIFTCIIMFLFSCKSDKSTEIEPVIENLNVYSNALEQATESIQNGDIEKAKSTLERAKTLAPKQPMAYFMSGTLYYMTGSFIESGMEFKNTLLRLKEDEKSDVIKQIDALTTAAQSKEETAYIKKGIQALSGKNYAQAEKTLLKAYALNKGNCASIHSLALAYKGSNKTDDAISLLEEGRQINPANLDILNSLQKIYFDKQDYSQEALIIAEKKEYYPSNPQDNFDYAVALHSDNKDDEALIVLMENYNSFPDFSPTYYLLGKIFFIQHENEKAKSNLSLFMDKEDKEQFKNLYVYSTFDEIQSDTKVMLSQLTE